VLKPDHLTELSGGCSSSKEPVGEVDLQEHWSFKLLSGYNLPRSRKKTSSRVVNYRVRITLYDGVFQPPTIHVSEAVSNYGCNPIWNEQRSSNFTVVKPSVAVVLFSLWDYDDTGAEDFIASAAIPVSCMRKGYRSVQLFSNKNTREGEMSFASLLVHALCEI